MSLLCWSRPGHACASRYNLSHVAIAFGDRAFAHQALRVAVSLNAHHAEAWSNLGVLEQGLGNQDASLSSYKQSQGLGEGLFEPHYNHAVAAYKAGNLELAHQQASRALQCYPAHTGSKTVLRLVTQRCSAC